VADSLYKVNFPSLHREGLREGWLCLFWFGENSDLLQVKIKPSPNPSL